MNKVWYRQLGYHNNPFSIKPAAFHNDLFGYEDTVARVIKAVDRGEFVFVEGEFGEGKTTILKHLVRHFGGHKKVIYFSVNRVEKRMMVRRLLNERYGRIGKWFDIRPDDMILLLDEVQDMDKRDVDKLVRFKKEGNFKSVVFVGQKYVPENFPEAINKTLNHFKLEKLKGEDAVKIVRRRVGDLPMVTDDIIKTVFAKSGYNARALLKNLEMLCKKAVDFGSEKISDKMLAELFGEDVLQEEPNDEKIFLEIEEDEKEEVKEEVSKEETVEEVKEEVEEKKEEVAEEVKEEVEEEKPKEELNEEWEDVAVEDKEQFEEEKKDFDVEDEIDEELAKINLEEEEEEKKVKITNGTPKAVAAEEALGKKTEDILDEHYY